jgi:hypothetical protein
MSCSPATLHPDELERSAVDPYTPLMFTVRWLSTVRWLAACTPMLCLTACNRQTCALPAETPRELRLTREADRRHLLADLAIAERSAEAYGRWAPNHAPSDSRFITSERLEQHARAYCEALLTEKISATHHLDVKTVERAFADLPRLSRR